MPDVGIFEFLGSWEITWLNKQIPVDVKTQSGRRRENVSVMDWSIPNPVGGLGTRAIAF